MQIKTGAKVLGLSNEILLAVIVANEVTAKHGQNMVLTEATGGKHGRGSLHYAGHAIDIRINYFSKNEAEAVANEIRDALGDQYDVILEDTHIHIEFQPK